MSSDQDKLDPNIVPVSKPVISDSDRQYLPDGPSLLVSGSAVDTLPSKQHVALCLDYSVLHGSSRDRPATFVLSLPAAGQIIRQVQEAVDECLQAVRKKDQE